MLRFDDHSHLLAAFGIYLRTGRRVVASDVEVKFNPWHNPEDGRFTFAGQGRYFPAGSRSGDRRGGGFRGGGGGSFGGGGASDSWAARPKLQPAPGSPSRAVVRHGPSLRSEVPRPSKLRLRGGLITAHGAGTPGEQPLLNVGKNGYQYRLDAHVRTRRASGQLVLGNSEGRSRRAQTQAGGKDRRRTDDGGHYIAARFNGPREAFNHFAQDASFNRGGYRALEDSWAKAIRSGHKVFVDIVPRYTGNSQRPDGIDIFYVIDGRRYEAYFPNGKGQK